MVQHHQLPAPARHYYNKVPQVAKPRTMTLLENLPACLPVLQFMMMTVSLVNTIRVSDGKIASTTIFKG